MDSSSSSGSLTASYNVAIPRDIVGAANENQDDLMASTVRGSTLFFFLTTPAIAPFYGSACSVVVDLRALARLAVLALLWPVVHQAVLMATLCPVDCHLSRDR